MVETGDAVARIKEKVGEVVVGLEREVEVMLVALLSDGHVLLEGPSGLGKTTLANAFSRAIGGEFRRIQMTPDLLPADVLGINVYNQADGSWRLRRGPIFGNVILVDEINRASPKVQSAFLEVMQERQVTIEGETMGLSRPFMVIATQVPYGEPGTYPLSSVQVDRFAYKVEMSYPEVEKEMEVLGRIDEIEDAEISPVIGDGDVAEMIKEVRGVTVGDRVKEYILSLVSGLREDPRVRVGPSPRASIWFMKGARARALMDGRDYAIPDDVKELAFNVLSHRVELTATQRAGGLSVRDVVYETLNELPVPKVPAERART